MRVAALYDVHGNLPALEAVLVDVKEAGVDTVVSGGDLVSGPFAAEVLDRLTALPDVRFVRGNADRLVVDVSPEEQEGLHAWCAVRLGRDRLETVASWPLTTEIEIDGLGRVLFCHATPYSDEPIFTRLTPDFELGELLGSAEVDLLVCGHTHVQFDRRLPSGLRVLNAGSIGMPYQGKRGAFWALLGGEVEPRHTEYDVEEAVSAMRETGAPLSEQVVGWLLEPPDPDEVAAFWESKRGA